MPNILNVTREEITWMLSGCNINVGAQANARLRENLGDDEKYFAPISVTTRGYTWSTPETGWRPMGTASEAQKTLIEAELDAVRQRVRQKLSTNPKFAESLLQLPNDLGKYIFYIDEPTGLRIKIAGWGFSNSRRYVPRDENPVRAINSRVGFSINGELQPNYPFIIITKNNVPKEYAADSEGYFNLGQHKIGTSIRLEDPDSKKSFSFEIEDGKEEYIFDVTRLSEVRVRVFLNGEPEPDAEICIFYHGENTTHRTNEAGELTVSLPVYRNESIEASALGATAEAVCTYPRTEVEIRAEEVILPPPIPKKVTVRCTNQHGEPCADYPLIIRVGDQESDYLTDKNGIVELPECVPGTEIVVSDGYKGDNPLSHIVGEMDNLIDYEVQTADVQPEDINLQMIGVDGNPVANGKVLLRHGDNSHIYRLDDKGRTQFESGEYECNVEMTAQILAKDEHHDEIPFTLDEDEHDYVIQEKVEEQKEWWRKVLNIVTAIVLILAIAEIGARFAIYLETNELI